jgi:hypothetical protein
MPDAASRRGPYLLLTGLGLLFFVRLALHPDWVLYSDHSDLLAEHLPAKRFLVRWWQATGEVPLWCPDSFAGAPFVHDIQVAAFYPPHGLLYLLPEEYVGTGMSWLVVFHVLVAGWTMFAYASAQGLGRLGALVAAVGYMFAGKWMLHLLAAGHYITVGLAWLPLVLLLLEEAIRRGSVLYATWAGAAFALIVLGTHPQWTFYAGLFIALWTLGAALERPGSRLWALAWWLGLGLWVVAMAVALSAIQLLPSLEAAGQSSRAAGVAADDSMTREGLGLLLSLFGPSWTGPSWEYRGGLGVLWLAAAAVAPVLRGGRVRYQAAVCLGLILFAVGGAAGLQDLPGFRFFRQPTRMLIVAGLPVAFLAGVTTDVLFREPEPAPGVHHRARLVLRLVLLAAGVVILLEMDRVWSRGLRWQPYWVALPLLSAVGYALLVKRRGPWLWAGLLLAELWLLAGPLVAVRPEAEIYPVSRCVRYLLDHQFQQWSGDIARILDRDLAGGQALTPLGAGAPLALVFGLEPVRGYNPLDVLRYKEYLQFIGNTDGPLRPLGGRLTYPVIGNFPVVNRSLLNLLGVRYLLQPAAEPPPEANGDSPWQVVERDPSPQAFNFVAGGVRDLPPYAVYENEDALPRAFFVPAAAPLPPRDQVLTTLRTTPFRRTVLLEDYTPAKGALPPTGEFRMVFPRAFLPNHVRIGVDSPTPGYLVLADVWYPGWRCTVDGGPTKLYRANFLFRAVAVDSGFHIVDFTFAPDSYARGKAVSLVTLAGLVGLAVLRFRGSRLKAVCLVALATLVGVVVLRSGGYWLTVVLR